LTEVGKLARKLEVLQQLQISKIMNHEARALGPAVNSFAILCAGVTALLLNRAVTPQLLDIFDAASEDVMRALRSSGVDEKQLQEMQIALARLRLALDEV
jgi:hypothetical protein